MLLNSWCATKDCFCELLEESSYRLSSSHHLAEMIPIVCRQEEKVCSEINAKNVSVIFDGTTHVCEAWSLYYDLRMVHKTVHCEPSQSSLW